MNFPRISARLGQKISPDFFSDPRVSSRKLAIVERILDKVAADSEKANISGQFRTEARLMVVDDILNELLDRYAKEPHT